MSLVEGYYREDLREEWQLDDQLCGNLCRCTGYRPIRDAGLECIAGRAEPVLEDAFRNRLRGRCEELEPITYGNHHETFHRPESLGELLELLRLNPQAQLVRDGYQQGFGMLPGRS
jgi:xanthine dehydrogenase iron-sulfur cluster and FAD-binding subunit A